VKRRECNCAARGEIIRHWADFPPKGQFCYENGTTVAVPASRAHFASDPGILLDNLASRKQNGPCLSARAARWTV